MDFTYFYKEKYSNIDKLQNLPEYDIFISMFVNSDRVKAPSCKIKHKNSLWLTFAEDIHNEFLKGKQLLILESNEDFDKMRERINALGLTGKKVCIDSTGFRVSYLLVLIRCLYNCNLKQFDVLYTEPIQYRCAEETDFTDNFYEVKQLYGLSGLNTSNTDNDLLIIAAGYDHSRIIDVAKNKKASKKILLFGFPSLSPDMFQENVLRAYKAETDIGANCFNDMELNIYSPAYDPFVTAQIIKEYIDKNQKKEEKEFSNIYLAPLSTKPQAIGMAIFFFWEDGLHKPYSIIYPFCQTYYPDNSEGISNIWRYTIELP